MTTSPYDFAPTQLADFCGPARQVGTLLQRIIDDRRPLGRSVLVLLEGDPGTGKTQLAQWLCRSLAASPFQIETLNGTELNVERLEQWNRTVAYVPTGGYHCWLIDEADAIPPAAATKILTFLDRIKAARPRPHSGFAVVLTSNYDIKKLPDRFQSRFQPFTITGPAYPEIKQFLADRWPQAGLETIDQISRMACSLPPTGPLPDDWQNHRGNLRQALLDLDTALHSIAKAA